MDFPGIATWLTANPLAGGIMVMLFMGYMARMVAGMGQSSSANLSNALAFAGAQSVELNKKSELVFELERAKGTVVAENIRLKAENNDLRLDVDILKSEVERLKVDARNAELLSLRFEDLTARLNALQKQHDALQLELDAEKRKNTVLQAKLDSVQDELDTLRGQTGRLETAPANRKFTEDGDEIL